MRNTFVLSIMGLILSLILAACGGTSGDVASLGATPTLSAAVEVLDVEIRMMEFAECLREEGMEISDPTVDSDGNIQMPELVEGATASKEEWIAAYDVCGEIIESITLEEKKIDRSDQVDQYVELAACMREEGFDLEDPTAESLDTWMGDLKNTFDWDDPDAQDVFDECLGGGFGEKGDVSK